MDNEKFLTVCMVLGAIALLAMPVGCAIHANEKVAQMVEAGKDPIAAKCAVWGESDGICQAYINSRRAK